MTASQMTAAEYDALPGLSQSGAKLLLRCPARYRWDTRPGAARTPTEAMESGTAVHSLLFEDGAQIVQVDADNWRAKAAQEIRDQARAKGLVPVLAKKLPELVAIAASVKAHPMASRLLDVPGRAEVAITATDPATGVPLHGRLDWLPDAPGPDGFLDIVDLKTTSGDASEDVFGKSAAEYGYALQTAFYQALCRLGGLDIGRGVRTWFVVVETAEPYLVSVLRLDPQDLLLGQRIARQAIDLYAACLRTDTWPGHVPEDGWSTITMPAWWRRKWEEA